MFCISKSLCCACFRLSYSIVNSGCYVLGCSYTIFASCSALCSTVSADLTCCIIEDEFTFVYIHSVCFYTACCITRYCSKACTCYINSILCRCDCQVFDHCFTSRCNIRQILISRVFRRCHSRCQFSSWSDGDIITCGRCCNECICTSFTFNVELNATSCA